MRLYLLIILLLFLPARPRVEAAPLVVQGAVDLSVVEWEREGIVNLTGGWQFYWNQLLTPTDIEAGQGKLSAYLSPEAEWHKIDLPGTDLDRIGSATYHLRVYVNEPIQLTLAVPVFNSASRIWINGELKQDFGKPSLTDADEEGYVRYNRMHFSAQKGENSITIQVSNHLFWYGGASMPLRIGPREALQQELLQATLQDALSFGFILFMALYHIYIRVLLKRSNGALYFGLLSLAVATRMGLIGGGQILYQIWPGITLQTRYLIEYMCVSSSVALLMSFYRELYPNESPKLLYTPAIYLSVAWCAFIFVAPPRYFPAPLDLFQLLILISGVASIGTVIVAARRGRDGASILVVSNFIFYLTVANEVLLSQRILQTISVVHYGLMFLIFSQALILARRFARSFDRAEKAEQEVTKLNQGLEQKILERTEQINTILAHVRSGFLLVDRNACLQNGFTSSSETILGQTLQVGESLPKQLGLPARLEMQFKLAIQQIFDSDLPTEVAMQQLPLRFPVHQRMIGLQAAAVKTRGTSNVTAVLLTINDVTDLVAAEEGLRRADILIHILEDQDAFRIFLADFKKDLESAAQAIAKNDATALHSILHTMKGNAASFNLDDWVSRLHQLEEQDRIAPQDIQSLTDHVRNFLRQNEGILHLDFDQPMRSVFGVDQSDLNALKETLTPVAPAVAIARVESWSRSVKALPLKSYTTPLGPMVNRVAGQLHKNVSLIVEGADAKVDNAFGSLLTTLPHLIRNALVHGIEDPEERGDKPAQATITLRFTPLNNGGLRIDIMDDGRGLDLESIRAHALEQGLITDPQQLSDEDIFALIFHPSFSTAEKVSDLAGRGMGLAAVSAAVQELGGRYEVRSQKGRSFHLLISVPPPRQSRLERAS